MNKKPHYEAPMIRYGRTTIESLILSASDTSSAKVRSHGTKESSTGIEDWKYQDLSGNWTTEEP